MSSGGLNNGDRALDLSGDNDGLARSLIDFLPGELARARLGDRSGASGACGWRLTVIGEWIKSSGSWIIEIKINGQKSSGIGPRGTRTDDRIDDLVTSRSAGRGLGEIDGTLRRAERSRSRAIIAEAGAQE